MGKPKQVSKGDLINAAKQQLLNKGQSKVTLKNVAEVAGVTQGSVYYHFKTKEHLFLALIKEFVFHGEDKKTGLKEWLSEEMYKAQTSSEEYRLLFELLALSFHQRDMKQAMGDLVNRRVKECASLLDGDLQKGQVLCALTVGLALQALFDQNFAEQEVYNLAREWVEKL